MTNASGSRRPDSPAVRTARRVAERSARTKRSVSAPAAQVQENGEAKTRRGWHFTFRMGVVIVVVAALLFSGLNTLGVFRAIRRDIADAKQEIVTTQKRIESLEDQLKRWEDPEYVKTQARERLGWVLPGERGYRVVGPDGQPYGSVAQIQKDESLPQNERIGSAWFAKLWTSVEVADDPSPAEPEIKTVPAPGEEGNG